MLIIIRGQVYGLKKYGGMVAQKKVTRWDGGRAVGREEGVGLVLLFL